MAQPSSRMSLLPSGIWLPIPSAVDRAEVADQTSVKESAGFILDIDGVPSDEEGGRSEETPHLDIIWPLVVVEVCVHAVCWVLDLNGVRYPSIRVFSDVSPAF